MDISINDYIRYNIDKFSGDENFIETVFGDSMNFPKEKQVAFSDTDFREFEHLLIEDVAISLYKIIMSNPLSLVIALTKTKMVKPVSTKGYFDNIKRLNEGFELFKNEMNSSVKKNREGYYIIFSSEENRKSYRNYMSFLQTITPVFQYALKVQKLCRDKRLSDVEFLQIATNYNKIIGEIFELAKGKLDGNPLIIGPGFNEMYEQYTSNFNRNLLTVEDYRSKAEEIESLKTTEISKQKVASAASNPQEQERLTKIKEANDLYDRFVVDFKRDLDKEVSLMNRDMYEALIDKFERFQKNFAMPLSSNASIGMATEAYSQISKMIETVYEISRMTYTPVVFGG